MTLREYFARLGAPGENSPVGMLMLRVLTKNPGMDFAGARREAHALLDRAAGRRRYTIPPVLSPQEKEREQARLRAAFGRSGTTEEQRGRSVSSTRGHRNPKGIGKLVSTPVAVPRVKGAQR